MEQQSQSTATTTTNGQPLTSATTDFAYREFETANDRIAALPDYLRQFIVDQNYDAYTAQDHAVWRYVMRRNFNFLRKYAHLIYFEGLTKTGIGEDHIPSIEFMNDILGKIGWAAVCVNGFIPPAAFMAFQAHRVLVIAADMRQIQHIEYTPSPDIIHESAGHAPCIADPEYAEYLRRIGEVGSKAMLSKKDHEMYEAIRLLSVLKEARGTDPEKIKEAEEDVLYKQDNMGKASEMGKLSRLHWWTVEYGLIGPMDRPKIYGAGLLSSIGEASECLKPHVKKIPYDLSAADYAYDITTMQPQLFVTPSFVFLNEVLNDFETTLAYKVGGRGGLEKAIECERASTAVYSSGLQVSGVFSEQLLNDRGEPVYVRTTSPTALAFGDKQLEGHGRKHHQDGFGSPVGKPAALDKPLESMTDADLEAAGVRHGDESTLEFESGVTVTGVLERVERRNGLIIIMTFSNCTVTYGVKKLFAPDWGVYDMAVGEKIISVFAGAADKDAYEDISMVSKTRTIKNEITDEQVELFNLYQRVRDYRDGKIKENVIPQTFEEVKQKYRYDWLIAMELLELLHERGLDDQLKKEIQDWLEAKAKAEEEVRVVIEKGIDLIYNPHPEVD